MVKIVDSIMGSGKTTWYMEYVNRHPEQKFIIVVPYIEECNRILEKCKERGFVQPETKDMPSKSASFHELLRMRHNIVTCHALFVCLKLTEEEIALIEQERYTLIVDETPPVAEELRLTENEIRALRSSGAIQIEEETKRAKWSGGKNFPNIASEVRRELERREYYYENDSLIWTLPERLITAFAECMVFTFMFTGTHFEAYLRAKGIGYEVYHLADGELAIGEPSLREEKARIRTLLDICDNEKWNRIGEYETRGRRPFSMSWWENSKRSDRDRALGNVRCFYQHYGAKAGEAMWTLPARFYEEKGCRVKDYASAFCPCNLRATNAFREARYLAYLLDIYEPPVIKNWFAARGQMTNERVYALNMLVQWVWRSAVRDGQKIRLYLPSQRMRNILYEWLEIPGEERPRIKSKVREKTAFQASSLKDKRVKHKEN